MVIRFRRPAGQVALSFWAMDSPAKQVMDRKFAIRFFFAVSLSNPFGVSYTGFLGSGGGPDDVTLQHTNDPIYSCDEVDISFINSFATVE
mgnify:CR=1 FL=1